MKRISFSDDNQELEDILDWFNINKNALTEYKEKIKNNEEVQDSVLEEFIGLSLEEVDDYFEIMNEELERAASLNLLSATEAKLRLDFLNRVYNKDKEKLSREFRSIYKKQGKNISLEQDILDKWQYHYPNSKRIIGDFKSALNYRNWLAHGRYWVAKLGRNYDFSIVYLICSRIVESLDLA